MRDADCDALCDAVAVPDNDTVLDSVLVREGVSEALCDTEVVSVDVADADAVCDLVSDHVSDPVAVAVAVLV